MIKKVLGAFAGCAVLSTNLLSVETVQSLNQVDQKVYDFQVEVLKQNRQINLNKVNILLRKSLDDKKNWYGYVFGVDFSSKGQNGFAKTYAFSDGENITTSLYNLKSQVNYKDIMHPTLDNKYYQDKFLISGKAMASHKMVIFSDPLCVWCKRIVPTILDQVKKSDDIAVYYIHLPLEMHPTAPVLSKASMLAKENGIKDVAYKIFKSDIDKQMDVYKESDEKKALEFFNKIIGTKYTLEQVNHKKFNDVLSEESQLSEAAMVNGTPTVFFDGEIDPSKMKFKQFLK